MKRTLLFLFISIISLSLLAQKDIDETLKELDKYYKKGIKEWNVPGMAVAIIKDGKVIFAEGYGIKDINSKEKVDKNTLFAIASNTKAFTSAAMAILVDEGKLSWDDPVRKYLPWFELYDPYVSTNMKIRDLLCHRTGLKTFAGDLIWYGTDYSREEIVRRAKHLEPTYGFREHYGYSNIMFIAAGLVIEEVSGQTWDDFVAERIFQPLKMNRTITTIRDLEKTGNFAAPHNEYKGEVISIPWLNWDNAAPVGGIISSVTDISKWLIMQLNNGIYIKDTIFSRRQQNEMWKSHTVQGVSAFSKMYFPSIHLKAYGLGWGLYDYLGRKIVTHNGGYDGMISQTLMVPEENLGIVILTNSISSLYYPIVFKTLDAFLSDQELDYSEEFNKRFGPKAKREESVEKPISNTKPSLELKDYTGMYGGKVYGNTKVYLNDNGDLILNMLHTDIFEGKLTHFHYNTFEIEFKSVPSLPKGKVNFIMDANGKITELVIDVPNPDFDFTELDFKKLY